jgi:hypothetical protein
MGLSSLGWKDEYEEPNWKEAAANIQFDISGSV